MTRGDAQEQGRPDQRGGGVPGEPNTFSDVTISKFMGMNTVSPRGSFGQPNWLENVLLDRLGGYSTAPFPRVISSFGDGITGMAEIGDANLIFVQTTANNFLYDLDSEAIKDNFPATSPKIANYKQGAVMGWDVTAPQGHIVAYTLSDDGASVVETSLTDLPSTWSITRVPVEGFSAGGGGATITPAGGGTPTTIPMNSSGNYPSGGRIGFSAKLGHWIMMYPQPYTYDSKPPLGTTLNPRRSKPDAIAPFIFYIPPISNDNKEYKLVFDNPSDTEYRIFGASMPAKRTSDYFVGDSIDQKYLRGVASATVLAGTLVHAAPISERVRPAVGDLRMVYQALNEGKVGELAPQWPLGLGATVLDGEVTWVNRGEYIPLTLDSEFAGYLARVSNAPVDYLDPEVEWQPFSNAFGEWAQLSADREPGSITIYRSRDTSAPLFYPHTFFPAGEIVESHVARTWVMADAVWRLRVDSTAPGSVIKRHDTSRWEQSKQRRTVYYSEPDTPWLFLERFIILPLNRSSEVVAMRAVGEYLVFLGDSDAVVLSGDSEANFYVQPLDIPGAFSQSSTVVHQGALYYRGVGGIYRMSGGKAEEISKPIANLIPRVPMIEESLSVDAENNRLICHLEWGRTLCYDIETDGWTVLNYQQDLVPRQIGKGYYGTEGAELYRVDGPHVAPAIIRYEQLDGGQPQVRKALKSVSAVVEASDPAASVSLRTQVHRPAAQSSDYSAPKVVLAGQSVDLVAWRTPDRFGYAFDIEIALNPAGSAMVLKPGISLEMYSQSVIRKVYP